MLVGTENKYGIGLAPSWLIHSVELSQSQRQAAELLQDVFTGPKGVSKRAKTLSVQISQERNILCV